MLIRLGRLIVATTMLSMSAHRFEYASFIGLEVNFGSYFFQRAIHMRGNEHSGFLESQFNRAQLSTEIQDHPAGFTLTDPLKNIDLIFRADSPVGAHTEGSVFFS